MGRNGRAELRLAGAAICRTALASTVALVRGAGRPSDVPAAMATTSKPAAIADAILYIALSPLVGLVPGPQPSLPMVRRRQGAAKSREKARGVEQRSSLNGGRSCRRPLRAGSWQDLLRNEVQQGQQGIGVLAARLHDDGLKVEETETPSPNPGEVLVRVHAAAITRNELEWPIDRLPAIPSYELSGVVVGSGDEVFALTPFDRDGVAAGSAVVPADVLAPKALRLTQ